MGLTATLGGVRATDVRWTIPAWGASYADVTLDTATTLTGATTLVLADQTLACTVLSGGPSTSTGRSYYRVVAGAGGWATELPQQSYSNDAGVKLLTVLSDAANAVGETLDTTTVDPTARLGAFWTRPADQACRLLEQIAPGAWYVGEDGETRLGARPASTLSITVATTTPVDLARQVCTLATDSIAQVLPGLSVNGLAVVDVEHTLSPKDGLRSRVWGQLAGGASRRLSALRLLLEQLDPDRRFRGLYEYRVVTASGNRLNLQAIRVSTGMPDVQRVFVRPGVSGWKGSPALGSRCVVGFVNADPTFPVVLSFEDPDGSGFLPTSSTVDTTGSLALGPSASGVALAGGGAAVGRVGDAIGMGVLQAGPYTVTQTTPPTTLLPGLTGIITAGSSKTKSG